MNEPGQAVEAIAITPIEAVKQPQKPPQPFITVENAREMQRRGAEKRRQLALQRQMQPKPPVLLVQPENEPVSPPATFTGAQVMGIQAEIEDTMRLLAKCRDPREKQYLSTALHRLYDCWCILTGTPKPGIRHPTKSRPSFVPFPTAPPPEA